MAGHARYTALLDACVLFPVAMCDALMSVAVTGLYAPKWTRRIDEEWMRSLSARQGIAVERLAVRRDQMHLACPDWEVPRAAWQALEPCVQGLPDSGDRHVLAAAVAGHADCIVTTNLRDFPADILAPYGLEAIHPDPFLVAQMDLDLITVLSAFKDMRARRRRPANTADNFADALERTGLTELARRLRDAAALI